MPVCGSASLELSTRTDPSSRHRKCALCSGLCWGAGEPAPRGPRYGRAGVCAPRLKPQGSPGAMGSLPGQKTERESPVTAGTESPWRWRCLVPSPCLAALGACSGGASLGAHSPDVPGSLTVTGHLPLGYEGLTHPSSAGRVRVLSPVAGASVRPACCCSDREATLA